MIATNAQKIIDARMQGFKPDQTILVSMIGRISADNHTVHAKSCLAYDWRWVRDLSICMCVGEQADWVATLKAIAFERPEFLSLWSCPEKWGARVYLIPTAEDIAKPVRLWSYELDFLPWLDLQNKEFQWN